MSRVLVIDDEKSIRVTLSALLAGAGYEVRTAEDAAAALRLLHEADADADVIVSDIVMPRCSGIDLLRTLGKKYPAVPVVLMTGQATAESAADAVREDAFDYVFKPVAKDTILAAVRRAAETKRLRDERARLAEVKQMYQCRLEQMVDDRTAELLEAKRQAEAVSQARGEFLSRISHELLTPLTGILGMNELLRDTELNEEQQEYAATIQQCAESLHSLVRNVLDLMNANEPESSKVLFRLDDVLERCCEKAEELCTGKGVMFRFSEGREMPDKLWGHPGVVQRVLELLLDNAVKYTAVGTIQLQVGIEESNRENAVLRFSVRDTGIGFLVGRENEMLEPFAQADTSSTRAYLGAGLGLSACRALLQRVGGKLGVEPMEAGACMWFSMPFALPSPS